MPAYKVQAPLQMLRAPMESVLLQLQRDFESYLAKPDDSDVLAALTKGTRQAHGVFAMLELPQAASLMRETWLLSQHLDDKKPINIDTARQLLSEVLLQAPRYFEWLQREGNKPYFDLLPLIDQLRALRIGQQVPAPSSSISQTDTETRIIELRRRLQQAFLRFLHGDHNSLHQASEVFTQLREMTKETVFHQTWGLAAAVCRLALSKPAAEDRPFRMLLRDLDRLLRAYTMQQKDGAQASDLCQRLEHHLANSEQGRQELAQVQATAKSGLTLSGSLDRKALISVAALLRQELSHNQELIDQFARKPTETQALAQEPQRLMQVANVLTMLELPIPKQLIDKQTAQIKHWLSGHEIATEPQLLASASDLAAVQSCLESFSDPSYSQALTSAANHAMDERSALTLLQELELKRARRLIAQEGGRRIDQVWLFATTYIDGDETPDWEEILPVLGIVCGLFVILDCSRAASITDQLSALVEEIAANSELIDRRFFVNGCAQVVVSLESYLGLLGNDDDPDQAVLDQAEHCLNELSALLAQQPISAFSEPNLTVEAGMDYDILPNQKSETHESAEPMDIVSFESTKPSSTHSMPSLPQDDEIIEIYLEEVQGEIANISEQLPRWRSNLNERRPLKEIRRSFHTLKGSSRMVGETALGEFAWRFEQLLNDILSSQLTPQIEFADAVEAAASALQSQVAQHKHDLGNAPIIDQLGQRADALRLGQASQTPVVPATPETAITEPAIPETLVTGPETPETAVTEKSAPLTTAAPSEITEPDLELIEALLEQGSEILDASDTTLQQWREDLDDLSFINNLRRGMHTLKGDARIAGQRPMGDLAHAMESILEAVSRGEIEGSAVLEPLQRTLDRLSTMLGQLSQHQPMTRADTLIAELNRILHRDDSAKLPEAESEEKATQEALLSTFIQETASLLDALDLTLRRWSQDTDNRELLADLQRDMHTLRGNARLAGFGPMGELAGAAGDMLQAVDKSQISINSELIDLTEQILDGLNRLLGQVRDKQTLKRPDGLLSEIANLLGETQSKKRLAAPIIARPQTAPKPSTATLRKALSAAGNSIRVDSELLGHLTNQIGESSIFRARVEQGVNAFRFNLGELSQTVTRLRQQLRRLEIETEAQILFRHEEGKEHGRDFDPLELDRFSELQQVSRSLLEIVDDLTSVQNGLEDQAQSITHLLYQQGQVNQEVQQNMMKTRMVRFSTVVPRLRRVLRQAAQELGKQAELELEGAESDVDRTVLEHMVPALEHMLRNAAAHGIETPEQRRAAGKPEAGRVTLALRREGAEQVVELRDDGGGLNFDAIRTKAESKGLLKAGQTVREQELAAFLLQPGFSTAEQVSQISGRGVGLDVLNEAIVAMRGALQIQSKPGRSTTFAVRLPFSLEVTQALLVQAGEDTFAVPLLSISAVDRLAPGELETYLAGETVLHHYGDHDYPVHNIGVLFGSEPAPLDEVEELRPPLLLFRSAEASAALQIDAILSKEEIVIKPVSPQLNEVPGISGATVLGDGRVVIVLDPAALVRNIEILNESSTFVPRIRPKEPERLQALVVDDSITMRKITTRLLERHNVRVESAKDGVEAVAALETAPPSFVILDIEMPRMDGFELLAHIRNQPHTKNLPVIMVTSRSGEKHRGRALRLGVDDYLIKPYQDDELLNSIRAVLAARGVELTL